MDRNSPLKKISVQILSCLFVLSLSIFLIHSQQNQNQTQNAEMGRKIVIVRHGERVDMVFGNNWTELAFDLQGNYKKFNLNMPDTIEAKLGAPDTHKGDSPLTQVGHLQGNLVGKGLRENNVLRPNFLTFVSPALRSIQTCQEVLQGMKAESVESTTMKVDPSLFEWTGFYKAGVPTWLTLEELSKAGFNVDLGYKSFLQNNELVAGEPAENYYRRSHAFVRHLLESVDESKDILLVCHGISIDALTRQLFGKEPKSLMQMYKTLQHNHIPFAAIGILEEVEKPGEPGVKGWAFKAPGAITMKHAANENFQADQQFPAHSDT